MTAVCDIWRDAGFEVIFTNFLVEHPGSFPPGKPLLFFSPTFFSSIFCQEKNVGEKNKTPSQVENFRSLPLVIGGGVIPNADARELEQWGIKKVFGPGSSAEQVVTFIRENAFANYST